LRHFLNKLKKTLAFYEKLSDKASFSPGDYANRKINYMNKLSANSPQDESLEAPVTLTLDQLPEPMAKALRAQNISELTEIQQRSLPLAFAGRDILAMSYTGSGKTLAFAIPIIKRLKGHKEQAPRALILAPTRELAMQVERVFRDTFREYGLKTLAVTGGASYGLQRSALNRKVDIVVGTPGRIVDLIDQGVLELAGIETFVLDEVDQMLDIGFADALEKVRQALPETIQTLFFSATMPSQIMRLARRLLRDPAEVKIGRGNTAAPLINHRYCEVLPGKRLAALVNSLHMENPQQAIVFCRTKAECSEVSEALNRHGFSSGKLNSDMSQNERSDTLNRFRNQTLRVLVATDVAARGIDIKEMPLVVNFTVPQNAESYTHRSGRTGRAGQGGSSWTFVGSDESRSYVFLMSRLSIQPTILQVPGQKDILSSIVDRYFEAPTAVENGHNPALATVRELVEAKISNLPPEECRKHLAALVQGQFRGLRVYESDALSPKHPIVQWRREGGSERGGFHQRGGDRDGDRGGRGFAGRRYRSGPGAESSGGGGYHRSRPSSGGGRPSSGEGRGDSRGSSGGGRGGYGGGASGGGGEGRRRIPNR
jgi:ATP-dependent RNA helicase DeaD